jgi:hypothetical protein
MEGAEELGDEVARARCSWVIQVTLLAESIVTVMS